MDNKKTNDNEIIDPLAEPVKAIIFVCHNSIFKFKINIPKQKH